MAARDEQDDPLFNARLPTWWERMAFFIRGLALGFLGGFLFSQWVSASEFGTGPILVVAVSLVTAMLPSLPKAWIEQRNRSRAMRRGTLMNEVDKRRPQ